MTTTATPRPSTTPPDTTRQGQITPEPASTKVAPPCARSVTRNSTLVRKVLTDEQRQRLIDNIVGHLLDGVSEPILQRAFTYWHNVDHNLGDAVASGVRNQQGKTDTNSAAGQPSDA